MAGPALDVLILAVGCFPVPGTSVEELVILEHRRWSGEQRPIGTLVRQVVIKVGEPGAGVARRNRGFEQAIRASPNDVLPGSNVPTGSGDHHVVALGIHCVNPSIAVGPRFVDRIRLGRPVIEVPGQPFALGKLDELRVHRVRLTLFSLRDLEAIPTLLVSSHLVAVLTWLVVRPDDLLDHARARGDRQVTAKACRHIDTEVTVACLARQRSTQGNVFHLVARCLRHCHRGHRKGNQRRTSDNAYEPDADTHAASKVPI